MNRDSRIYVAGHRGLVGSAIVRRLRETGHGSIVVRAREALDLRSQMAVHAFFDDVRPEYVFLAAARVGGIRANISQPGAMIADNLAVQCNVIDAAKDCGVAKLLFMGSSCIYPRECPQPIKEEYAMTGPLEPTNRAYAMAKLAGIEMLEAYRAQYGFQSVVAMPTNLYGPNDNYDLDDAHVLPALIRRLHEAKARKIDRVVLMGDGTARREFLHADDCAKACLLLMREGTGLYNVGSGSDMTVRELAGVVAEAVGYMGKIAFSGDGPNGTPRKLLDSEKLRALGWRPTFSLGAGLVGAYRSFLAEGT
jgi:GDP-L-fucose synthase